MLRFLTDQATRGTALSSEQVAVAVANLVQETVPAETKADFLGALARKGETVEEIAAFARELRDKSISPPIAAEVRSRQILDVCGTGGDRLNTFNISTTTALILASAEVPVAKHGNRAITSQAGSADVLEALGVPTNLSPEEAARSLLEHSFAFFFAPQYHPCFKHIAPARRICAERGQRTIFNFLGPLLNPARPSAQLVGVPNAGLCEPLARVLQTLGVRRGMVVCGQFGESCLDELSTMGENTLAEFYQEHGFAVTTTLFNSPCFQPATLHDLAGGDRYANAKIVRQLLDGQDRGPKRDAVLLNSGAALFVAGKARTIQDGWQFAVELIDGGKAIAKLRELVLDR
ncbi:MAG: anthranilate phosphoribosyltransferase [Candidatus Omnitrophica bacterium]|nr:anthranilate phosphoribosyltransferase [Candidatus Omnitrophota bacterium]